MWGANALTGVVNVITKSPRELVGDSLLVSVGTFGRDFDERRTVRTARCSRSRAATPRRRAISWAYKITAGFFTQDALGRPSGLIPNSTNTPYPDYENTGTSQPKLDVRVDHDFAEGKKKLVFAGGFAGTEGMIHTGIGPFDIDRGTYLAYGKVNYSQGGTKRQRLRQPSRRRRHQPPVARPDGRVHPLRVQEHHLRRRGERRPRLAQGRHVVSYGGNVRYNSFELSLAPRGDSRTEVGVYGQDEIFLNRAFPRRGRRPRRQVLVDRRRGVLAAPDVHVQAGRPRTRSALSYNRAYRAPSHVNNFLDVTLVNALDLGALNPALAGRTFVFPVHADRQRGP